MKKKIILFLLKQGKPTLLKIGLKILANTHLLSTMKRKDLAGMLGLMDSRVSGMSKFSIINHIVRIVSGKA